jgi:hypothetical protein
MHFSVLATTARFALLLLLCGCATPKTSSASSDEALIKQLVAFSPINGHWVTNGFAGQFDDLRFVQESERENGKIVYRLDGRGALWTKDGLKPFALSGRSVGSTLQPVLKFADGEIKATGEVVRDDSGWPACTMVFVHGSKQYQASLDCVGDRATAKEKFLAQPSFIAAWKGKYVLTGTDHPIEFTISDKYRILGTYDDGDWRKGKVHGNASKDGKFKFLLKYGSNPSFAQILGTFTLSADGKELRSDDARYEYNTTDPDEKRPQKTTVLMTRIN